MLQDNIFTTVIQSCQLSRLPSFTVTYNSKDFSDIVCVKLPPEMPRDFSLMELYDLDASKDIDFTDAVFRSEFRPWIDIKSSILDTSAGQHVYRMTFFKGLTNDLGYPLKATCWFSYIIQDNNPDKPYIYMKRDEGGSSDSSEE